MILGTAAYMPPEQARGKPVDKRADIWAFGVLLFEMLTGHRAFVGETVTDVLAAVVKNDPDWRLLPAETPAHVRNVLRRCLHKTPETRLRDIGDARLELLENEDPDTAATVAESRRRPRILLSVALALLSALAASLVAWSLRPQEPRRVIRIATSVPFPDELLWQSSGITVSPDGARFVFRNAEGGRRGLYLRSLDELEPRFIEGSQNGVGPFFSADGQSIGFFVLQGDPQDPELRRVAVDGGTPSSIASLRIETAAGFTFSGSWGTDDSIAFSGSAPTILRVMAAGGTPVSVTGLDETREEVAHLQPSSSPAQMRSCTWPPCAAVARTSWSRPWTGKDAKGGWSRERAPPASLRPATFCSSVARALFAVPFDRRALSVGGPERPVVEGPPREHVRGFPPRSVRSRLRRHPGLRRRLRSERTGQMVWVDRRGQASPVTGAAAAFMVPRLSPDGSRLAYSAIDPQTGQRDVWVLDIERGARSRLTSGPGHSTDPVWSPDGRTITYGSSREEGVYRIFSVAADGTGEPLELLRDPERPTAAPPRVALRMGAGWSFYETGSSRNDVGVWRPGSSSVEYGSSRSHLFESEKQSGFSPDGRFVAYVSDKSGRREIYVRTVSGPERQWLISTDGGDEPVWSPAGGEIFYRHGSQMMVVRTDLDANFEASAPKVLFEGRYDTDPFGNDATNYDVTRDGTRFVMIRHTDDPASSSLRIDIVINWVEELKRPAVEQ